MQDTEIVAIVYEASSYLLTFTFMNTITLTDAQLKAVALFLAKHTNDDWVFINPNLNSAFDIIYAGWMDVIKRWLISIQ